MADGTFIDVEVDDAVAADPALAAKLAEVCPVDIFAQATTARCEIVEENLDECVLCELCIDATPAGTRARPQALRRRRRPRLQPGRTVRTRRRPAAPGRLPAPPGPLQDEGHDAEAPIAPASPSTRDSTGLPTPAVVAVENGRIAMRVPCAVSAATTPTHGEDAGETSSSAGRGQGRQDPGERREIVPARWSR